MAGLLSPPKASSRMPARFVPVPLMVALDRPEILANRCLPRTLSRARSHPPNQAERPLHQEQLGDTAWAWSGHS